MSSGRWEMPRKSTSIYALQCYSRRELQDVSYEAIGQLATAKAELGVLPRWVSKAIQSSIAETKGLLHEMELALERDGTLPPDLRP